MLTASLQSTWEAQRSKPRPKYGNPYLSNPLYEEDHKQAEEKAKAAAHGPSGYYSRGASDGLSSYPTELPNLKIPQGTMNRANLSSSTNFSATSAPANAVMNSPRSGAPKEILGMPKKTRGASRQSAGRSHSGNRRSANKYGNDGYESSGLGKTQGQASHPDTSNGAYFPQIANAASSASAGVLAPKRNGLAHGGLLTTISGSGKGDNNFIVTEDHAGGAVTSIRGLKPGNPNWINQDNFLVMESFDGKETRVYGVLDGHGENGHLVSRRCRENFPHFIVSTNLRMELAFNMMHNDLTASDFDVRCSGATCVVSVIQGGKLTVYNCGDSRAVLGRRAPNGTILAQPLSNDHKPDRPEERKRILSCGGHLGCRQVFVNQGNRGPVSMPVGPCRVWYQHRGETLGLAMSRSLGDAVVHKFGVSAEPEAIEHVIDDNDEFLILATDGVWDVVDNNHAVQLVHNFSLRSPNWSALEASSALCKFARSRWEKLSPMIDDITCVIVKLR